ncbi:hypothetical protein QBC34DRAFT_66577 [Podospora aff. communis PSN243]|uniref:F-box domain-containing protein n=1 Tax=Podospora aff. communis PSN243 TaxID=3040156 RepID=A0AAV9H5Q3_9PEZI|nr:hypothetical protein QBC34DRAFT_66577 [Podospora aff. communis PSN243]
MADSQKDDVTAVGSPSPDAIDETGALQSTSTAPRSTTRHSTASSTSAATTATTTTIESPSPPPKSQSLALIHQPLPRPRKLPRPLRLLALPDELLLQILTHLDFASLVHLRRTCHQLRALTSPHTLRTLLGPSAFQSLILTSCKTCLVTSPDGTNIVLASPDSPGYPLASQCVTCSLAAKDARLTIERRAPLGNFEVAHGCRWCGWPVVETRTGRYGENFHVQCAWEYQKRLFWFFVMGWVQLGLGVTGAAMAWRWFRGVVMVFGPTVASFLMLWVCIFSLIFRSKRRVQVTLFLETTILGLWIPPVYYLAKEMWLINNFRDYPIPKSSIAALTMWALNMLFRLLNVLGNLILLSGYDMTRRHRPSPGIFRKMVHPVLSRLVFWTYPQSLERTWKSAR